MGCNAVVFFNKKLQICGSGFFIGQSNYIMTAYHLFKENKDIFCCYDNDKGEHIETVSVSDDGHCFKGKIEAYDKELDIALIKVLEECGSQSGNGGHEPFIYSKLLVVPQYKLMYNIEVQVYGYNGGEDVCNVDKNTCNNVATNIRTIYAEESSPIWLYNSGSINRGFSGGPCVLNGYLIGMSQSIIPDQELVRIIPAKALFRFCEKNIPELGQHLTLSNYDSLQNTPPDWMSIPNKQVKRSELIDKIEKEFNRATDNMCGNTVLICGREGIGKTVVAYQYMQQSGRSHIYYLHAKNEESLNRSIWNLIDPYNLRSNASSASKAKAYDVNAMEQLKKELCEKDDYILCFDEWNLEMDYSELQRTFLNQCPKGRFLITSTKEDSADFFSVTVKPFSIEQACELLKNNNTNVSDRKGIEQLNKYCKGNPRILKSIWRYAQYRGRTIDYCLEELTVNTPFLEKEYLKKCFDKNLEVPYLYVLDIYKKGDEYIRSVLRICSCLDKDNIDLKEIQEIMKYSSDDEEYWNNAENTLFHCGIFDKGDDSKYLSTSQLYQSAIRFSVLCIERDNIKSCDSFDGKEILWRLCYQPVLEWLNNRWHISKQKGFDIQLNATPYFHAASLLEIVEDNSMSTDAVKFIHEMLGENALLDGRLPEAKKHFSSVEGIDCKICDAYANLGLSKIDEHYRNLDISEKRIESIIKDSTNTFGKYPVLAIQCFLVCAYIREDYLDYSGARKCIEAALQKYTELSKNNSFTIDYDLKFSLINMAAKCLENDALRQNNRDDLINAEIMYSKIIKEAESENVWGEKACEHEIYLAAQVNNIALKLQEIGQELQKFTFEENNKITYNNKKVASYTGQVESYITELKKLECMYNKLFPNNSFPECATPIYWQMMAYTYLKQYEKAIACGESSINILSDCNAELKIVEPKLIVIYCMNETKNGDYQAEIDNYLHDIERSLKYAKVKDSIWKKQVQLMYNNFKKRVTIQS